MVYGLPPFYSTHVDEMYQGILHKPLKLKSTVSVEMRSFLSKILEKNPENRLGHAPDGWQQIQNHSFFRQINFSDLLLKKYRPDFIPAVVSPLVFSDDLLYKAREPTHLIPELFPSKYQA